MIHTYPKRVARIQRAAVFVSAMILLLAAVAAIRSTHGFLVTNDQRAQRMFDQGDFKGASETYRDAFRKGVAQYRNADFKQAAATFAGLPTADAAFNQGNSLVMQGKYEPAIEAYQRALEQHPNWEAAETNLAIARGRWERIKQEGGNSTDGMLGADDVVFDQNSDSNQEGQKIEQGASMSDQELQSIWLRQIKTTPRDFLRSKFAFQAARPKTPRSEQQP